MSHPIPGLEYEDNNGKDVDLKAIQEAQVDLESLPEEELAEHIDNEKEYE